MVIFFGIGIVNLNDYFFLDLVIEIVNIFLVDD